MKFAPKRHWWIVVLIVGTAVAMWLSAGRLRPGIDLAGGTILVYELVPGGPKVPMDRVVTAVRRRIDPANLYGYKIQEAGPNRFEVVIPLQEPSPLTAEARRVRECLARSLDLPGLAYLAHGIDHRGLVEQARQRPDPRATLEGGHWVEVPEAGSCLAGLPELAPGEDRLVVQVPDEAGGVWCLRHRASPEAAAKTYVLTVEAWLTGDVRVREVKARLSKLGQLEFRILANTKDHPERIEEARKCTSPDKAPADTLWVKQDKTRPVVHGVPPLPEGVNCLVHVFSAAEGGEGRVCAMRYREPGKTDSDIYLLAVLDPYHVTGDDLLYAEQGSDRRGLPAVAFTFGSDGAKRFFDLTFANRPDEDGFKRRLAIILDQTVMSAPVLNDAIGARGIIEGGGNGFEPDELKNLIAILNAGKLPSAIQSAPIQEYHQGPDLGADTIRKGTWACLIAAVAVVVFMAVYYLAGGMVANIALVMNIAWILIFMAVTNSTITLPGLAGLALTVGMSVDANVLILERIREERRRGSSLALAIKNGYDKAFRAIFDANITTLITAIILYNLGTEVVKGFALVLAVGLVTNLITAVYVTRLITETAVARRWFTQMRMLQFFRDTRIPFMRFFPYCLTGSLVLIVLGMTAFFVRGSDNFDIDFTGGTRVAIHTREPMDPGHVRAIAEQSGLPSISVVSVQVAQEPENTRFNIMTTDPRQAHVQEKLLTAFDPYLVRTEMTWSPPQKIASSASHTQPAGAASSAPATQAVAFPGGWRTNLSFNRPMTVADVHAQILAELQDRRVPNPDALFAVQGLGQPDLGEAFRQMRLETSLDTAFLSAVAQRIRSSAVFERVENFGSQVAEETKTKALVAIIYSWLAIIAYVWVRFGKLAFGLAGVLALVHDVLITLSAIAISHWIYDTPIGRLLGLDDFKIDLVVIGALLTIVGFSINDTIVVFDRIREVKGKAPYLTPEMIDTSVNQTLARTVLTTLTAFITVVILYIWGGPGVHGFAFCMIVGMITGTYSTVFIASPLLIVKGRQAPAGVRTPEYAATRG